MDVYLIRHAHAGNRGTGSDDRARPLSDRGRQRAGELVDLLASVDIARVVSSPALRCTQTVDRLAEARDVELEIEEDLWEGTPLGDVMAVLEKLARDGGAACGHGDTIPDVIDRLAKRGVPIRGRGCEKGSVWILSHDGTDFTGAAYVSRKALTLDPR